MGDVMIKVKPQIKVQTIKEKKQRNSHITVVIPTLNEEENIAGVIEELNEMGYYNLVIVDAKSTDETVEIAKKKGANVIFQTGNGKGNALREAFAHSFVNGEIVVMMDADGSMDPKEIPSFVEALKAGADVVKGSRFLAHAHSKDFTALRKIGNQILIFIANQMHSTGYSDLCYGFAAFNSKALRELYPKLKSKNFEIETEVFIKAKKLGLKVVEVPSIEYARKNGRSKLNIFKDGLRIFGTIILESLNEN